MRSKELGWLIVTAIALAFSTLMAFLSGSRSGLLGIAVLCIAAFNYARFPRIRLRELFPWLAGACIALVLGMMIITPYRTSRQNERGYDSIPLSEIASLMRQSTHSLLSWKVPDIVNYTADRIVERFSAIEMLGITLARAKDEAVQASERSVGMDNNIVKNLFYDFVPRVIWHNKPIVSNIGLWFSRIYCDSPHRAWSGPSIFGDLYRNFGYLGIPFGMFVLGILLRIIYERLIIRGNGNAFAVLVYYFLLNDINYEGFYSFIGGWLRTIFVLLPLFWIATRGRRRYPLSTSKRSLQQ